MVSIALVMVGSCTLMPSAGEISESEVKSSLTTIYVPDNYSTIQAAVNAAFARDTIIVRDGTYTENVNVNKRLTIRSENGSTNCIVLAANSSNNVFEVTANYVNISGFTVTRATEVHPYGIIRRCSAGIRLDNADYCNVSENVVTNYDEGIALRWYSRNNVIANNTISNNSKGIRLEYSYNNIITNNAVNKNKRYGILLWWSSNNTLTNNTMSGNKYNFGVRYDSNSLSDFIQNIDESNKVNGKPIYYWINQKDKQIPSDAGFVAVINSKNVTIRDLTLTNNGEGVLLAHSKNSRIGNNNVSNNEFGIILIDSSNNCIENNSVSSSGEYGIHLFSNSICNNIANNCISNNAELGIYLGDGSSNNGIKYNTISNNGLSGIDIGHSSGNDIEHNNILNNYESGIWLYNSSNNNITNNNIENNNDEWEEYGYGIRLSYSSNTLIYLNDFINNTCNVYSSNSSNIWNSTEKITYTYNGSMYTNYMGNYWDDYNGTDADSDGIGDTPYILSGDNPDNHSLTEPFENYVLLATPTTTPPGFEAVIAIAGLSAVAYILLRRRRE